MRISKINFDTPDNTIAFSTLRGTSTPEYPYSGFNVCHYTNDDVNHIAECRQDLCSDLGITLDRLIIPQQTHSTKVAIVDHIPTCEEGLQCIDAIVTRMKNVALGINTADCVPVLLVDSKANVIAAAHAGWRGTIYGIIDATIKTMIDLGAVPHDIHAIMGPCICADCFEVGEEVATKFRLTYPNQGIVIETTAKPHIDLPAAIKTSLLVAGLKPNNITLPPTCSRCNPDTLFSARAIGVNSGRTLSVIMQY